MQMCHDFGSLWTVSVVGMALGVVLISSTWVVNKKKSFSDLLEILC